MSLSLGDIARVRQLCLAIGFARGRLKAARHLGLGTLEEAVDDALAALDEPFTDYVAKVEAV